MAEHFMEAMEPVLEQMRELHVEIDEHQLALDGLYAQRDAAVAEVVHRFGPDIAQELGELDELRERKPFAAIKEAFLEYIETLDAIHQAALGILVNEYHGVDRFCMNLMELWRKGQPGDQMPGNYLTETFNGFQLFAGEIAGSGTLSVALLRLSWFEETDPQAHYQGEVGNTGVFHKVVEAYFAEAPPTALQVRTKEVTPDSVFSAPVPTAVELRLEQPRVLRGTEERGKYRTHYKTSRNKRATHTLIGDANSSDALHRRQNPLIWGASKPDTSLWRETEAGRRRDEPQTLLLYGSNLITTLKKLVRDDEVHASVKEKLQAELTKTRLD